ncbi:zinc finger (CCCH type) motif-containing protein [Cardiosporidium cionae]|uniref:Zinc finger (CCCH type) motif-containing protein n=1 Tax=Cardiosporidium cionae TaxID=476202 RepID=A0ABQ7JA06_9APIC|nr:zinc finger (CCCH type) motif-containing protein [Cardiosporidium cionae]|eukprot:KAF8820836.1 zinc finger (CCCH type) motif-containing protein [Cardiosporidium cionae]
MVVDILHLYLVSSLYKTSPCAFFAHGTCTRGEFCTFFHHPDERREHPDFKKTKICELWEQRCCIYQDIPEKCRFAHGEEDLKIANRKFKLPVECMRGDSSEEKCRNTYRIDKMSTGLIYRNYDVKLSQFRYPIVYEE